MKIDKHIISRLTRLVVCCAALLLMGDMGSQPVYAASEAAFNEATQKYHDKRDKCDEALKNSAKAGVAFRTAVHHEQWMQSIDRDRQTNKQGMRGEILVNHCLDKIMDPNGFFKMLRDMFSGGILAGLIDTVLNGLLNQLINRVCTWMSQALNNAMNSVCLPLPSFGFELNLDLPSLNAKKCGSNTLSMGDVVAFSSNYRKTAYPSTMRDFVRYARGKSSSGRPIY